VQVVYCNHQTTDLSLRERLSFSIGEQLTSAYRELLSIFPSTECVFLSTCNRVELYTAQKTLDDPPTHQRLAQFLSDFHHVPLSEFSDGLLECTGSDAVRHLFQVASSIDSMVLGEPQIVNQVKEAYQLAQQNNACGPLTHAMFQGAINVSKRVRTETRLAERRVSIASVAVDEFGKSIFDRFDNKTVLIIGGGAMAEETLRHLQHAGVGQIMVTSRSPERVDKLVTAIPGAIVKLYQELDRSMAAADVIVSTTGADRPIVDFERFYNVRRQTDRKPVIILDLGAPRDFEPAVVNVDDNVFLYDLDDLQATCEKNRKARSKEVEQALYIIDEETDRFMQDVYHRATGPTIVRLREQWHRISREEMDQLRGKLQHLEDNDFESVQRSIERIVNKLLHPPLEALRDESRKGTPHGLLDALKRLFLLRD